MSSGFVPGGSNDQPVERDSDWTKARQDIATARRRKEDEGKQEGGKSLYEVLQANKASKQEAFEESIRLKNQFRALEEDEVEFLDSVLESTRAKEAAVKRETAEQLETFRTQREAADQARLTQGQPEEEVPAGLSNTWATYKKRRRGQVEDGSAMKRKKPLSDHAQEPTVAPTSPIAPSFRAPVSLKAKLSDPEESSSKPAKYASNVIKLPSTTLGLDDYSSEDG